MSQSHDDDAEGTVIRPAAVASASATGVSTPAQVATAATSDIAGDGLSLRIGARIAEFEITGRVGDGGFSIVYLALDHSLERTVALKEYLPASLATRAGTVQVQPRSQRYRDTFEAGLKSFINEAKLLAHFDHPALVKVYRFWEANGTAYMVMPFYQGVTVKDTVRALPAPPDEAWLMSLLAPLTEALLVLHAEQCFHRDVAPDNVLLLAGSGKPLLLDFGAARRVIGDMTQALTVILKAGYAPVEQYAEVPGMKQGPWTDVYALAAVVYWAITGSTPPASVGRMLSDSFVPLAERAAGRYSPAFLQAIDRALVVRPEQRTQTIGAFRQDLGLAAGPSARPPQPMLWNDPDATVIRVPAARSAGLADSHTRSTGSTPTQTAPRDPVHTTEVQLEEQRTKSRNAPSDGAPASQVVREAVATRPGHLRMIAAISVLGVVIAASGVWWAQQRPAAEASRAVPQVVAPVSELPATTEPAAKPTRTIVAEEAQPVPAPASSPVESIPTVPQDVAVERPATQATVGTPREQAPARPARIAGESKPDRRLSDAAKSEECGRMLSRISLGENSPELMARLKVLNCR